MATDPRKRQKKLERRNAKRKDKKHSLMRKQQTGIAGQMRDATKYPVVESLISDYVWTEGIGPVLLSRRLPDGSIAVAFFLVDRFCLGVKDAMAEIMDSSIYATDFLPNLESNSEMCEVSPSTVRKLVEEAVAYAGSLGLAPHADYHKAKPIFGEIDPRDSEQEFEFGEKGQPLFIAGPYDTPERCRQILAILTHSCGPDGFHYVLPVFSDMDRILPEALRRQQARLIGPNEKGDIVDIPINISKDDL